MNRTIFIFIIFSFTNAMAATGTTPTVEIGLGTNITEFNYKELCTPSDQESAKFASILANVKYHPPDMLSYFEFEYESSSPKSTYSGASLSTNQSVVTTNSLSFVDYVLKFNVALSDNVFVYIGYGHHSWNRVLNNSYSEKYQWDVAPVGLLAWYSKSDTVDLGIDLGLLPMLNSKIGVDTSDYTPGGTNNSAPLGNKTGFRVKFPVVWHYDVFSFETTPWFEHTEIGKSDTYVNSTLFTSSPYTGYEPNSETYIFGLQLTASVHF